jgi:hypothetical protein
MVFPLPAHLLASDASAENDRRIEKNDSLLIWNFWPPYDIQIACSFASPVAQLVEQVTVNHRVGGSSPSRGANLFRYLQAVWVKNHLLYQLDCVWIVGENRFTA